MKPYAEYWEEENAVIFMSVTAGIGSSQISVEAATQYCLDYFPTVDFCSNDNLISQSGASGIPFSAVIQLSDMTVIGREGNTGYLTYDGTDIYVDVKDAI